jgi:hypothetical protein
MPRASAGMTAEEGAPVPLRQDQHYHKLNKID